MDITMNAKNGIATAAEILSFDPGARIVMVTALGMDSQRTECERIGVKAFVTKPFDPARLLDVMRRMVVPESSS
jgi:two-component system chemotaxis response regulator CheY